MNMKLEDSNTEQVSPLLEDFVRDVLGDSKCSDSFQKDLLFVLIIVLMIENGYSPMKNEDDELIADAKSIALKHFKKWRSPAGILDASFMMNGFTKIPLKLIVTPLGATSIINLIIMDLDCETYSVCLPMSRYVVSPQASHIPLIFRDLKHFSVIVKNKVLSPVKSRILLHCGYPSASLIGLPEEVFLKVVLYLPVCDILHVSITCTRLKYLVENEALWRKLCKRDFPNTSSDRTDWRLLYKEKYLECVENKARERSRDFGAMHDYMDYSDYMSYIENPLWENIII